MRPTLAVTVIAGFLGAGKTTLVNRLLGSSAGRRGAILVNDFGAINIDERLIENRAAGVMTLTNGCICCNLQANFLEQVEAIVSRHDAAFDFLAVETSGVSDPSEIQRALGYPGIREQLTLSSVATLVDATQFCSLAGAAQQLAERQVLAADIVLISKRDLATATQADAVHAACQALGVRCLEMPGDPMLWSVLFGMEPRATPNLLIAAPGAAAPSLFEHWSFTEAGPYRLQALRQVLASLPAEIYRAKGFTHIEEYPDGVCVVQVVGDRVDIRRGNVELFKSKDALVFIGARGGVDWNELAERLRACRPAAQRSSAPAPT